VKSEVSPEFIKCFQKLPQRIRRQARKNYRLWKRNPSHSSLQFKRVGKRMPVYSVRVAIGWRALAVKQNSSILWFWIGSHAAYERMLKQY
jgi:hypothetical protein